MLLGACVRQLYAQASASCMLYSPLNLIERGIVSLQLNLYYWLAQVCWHLEQSYSNLGALRSGPQAVAADSYLLKLTIYIEVAYVGFLFTAFPPFPLLFEYLQSSGLILPGGGSQLFLFPAGANCATSMHAPTSCGSPSL